MYPKTILPKPSVLYPSKQSVFYNIIAMSHPDEVDGQRKEKQGQKRKRKKWEERKRDGGEGEYGLCFFHPKKVRTISSLKYYRQVSPLRILPKKEIQ